MSENVYILLFLQYCRILDPISTKMSFGHLFSSSEGSDWPVSVASESTGLQRLPQVRRVSACEGEVGCEEAGNESRAQR